MSDQIKKLAPAIWSEIQKANKILLCFHPRPDPDSLGSNLAMSLILRKLGKEVLVIVGDDPKPPPSLNFLPGYNFIVEKSFGDVKLPDYDLFVSMDAADLNRVSNKVELTFPLSIKTIVIDHHKDNPEFGTLNIIHPESISTCQLLWEILETVNYSQLDKDIATCLYTGIWSDTGNLIGATPRTFEIMAKLLNLGVDANGIIKAIRSTDSYKLVLICKFLSNLQRHFGGKVISAVANYKDFSEANVPEEEIGDVKEQAIGMITSCNDSYIQAFIYEYTPGSVSVSLRSFNPQKNYDVSKISKEMGGGGHPGASSAKFNGTPDEAKKFLLETIQKVYPDLGQP